jgi:hypothetical protein
VVDGLSRILQHEVNMGKLKELQISRRGLSISQLLSVDDTLLFREVLEEQSDVVDKALRQYERCMGQLINPSKCLMMVGSGCSQECKDRVMEILQVSNVASEEKYPGLPTPQVRMSGNNFKSTRERLAIRLSTYAKRFMSSGVKKYLLSQWHKLFRLI